jgi:hypothetical protein
MCFFDGVFMVGNVLGVIGLAASMVCGSYGSEVAIPKLLVKLTSEGHCSSPCRKDIKMEKCKLETPSSVSKKEGEKFVEFMDVYIVHEPSVNEAFESLRKENENVKMHEKETVDYQNEEEDEAKEVVENTINKNNSEIIKQLQESVKALGETIEIVRNPLRVSEVKDLPEENKIALLDLACRLIEEGETEFSVLKDALSSQTTMENSLTFDDAAETINWGFQTGQDYKKYTLTGHPKSLAHLIHCFIVSKGYEIQKLSPPIAIEDLQILVKNVVDYSGYEGHSSDLLEIARQLEAAIK